MTEILAMIGLILISMLAGALIVDHAKFIQNHNDYIDRIGDRTRRRKFKDTLRYYYENVPDEEVYDYEKNRYGEIDLWKEHNYDDYAIWLENFNNDILWRSE